MQKFSKISTLAISLVAVLVLPMLAQSATAWPNLNSTIITMPTVDNSAMAWNAINSKLFTLTDKNIITKMDLDGNNKDFANSPKCNGNILG